MTYNVFDGTLNLTQSIILIIIIIIIIITVVVVVTAPESVQHIA